MKSYELKLTEKQISGVKAGRDSVTLEDPQLTEVYEYCRKSYRAEDIENVLEGILCEEEPLYIYQADKIENLNDDELYDFYALAVEKLNDYVSDNDAYNAAYSDSVKRAIADAAEEYFEKEMTPGDDSSR